MAVGVTIRAAGLGDIDWLVSELKKFAKFLGTKRSLFGDEEYARNGLLMFLREPNVMFIADKDGTPVGFAGGVVTPHMFNPQIRILAEAFWWVQEEHRGSKAGLKLLNTFTEWGKRNADWVSFTLERKSPVNEKCLLKRGYVPHERTYLLEVE